MSVSPWYWFYDKMVSPRRRLQVEGARLDAGEVLARVLRHLEGGPRLPTRDHVPPHVQLGKTR